MKDSNPPIIHQRSNRHCLRINPANPDHHLYNNNGTWWVHYTEYPCPLTSRRVRRSLRTSDRERARRRRDKLFEILAREADASVEAA